MIRHVLNTKHFGLKLEQTSNNPWEIACFSKSVTLSSSQTAWVDLSEAVKEVMFVIQLLESMQISVKLQVMVSVHDVGVILMVSNITTMSHTKHVYIRYKYLNE